MKQSSDNYGPQILLAWIRGCLYCNLYHYLELFSANSSGNYSHVFIIELSVSTICLEVSSQLVMASSVAVSSKNYFAKFRFSLTKQNPGS